MNVLQIVPKLEVGGVERGVVDFSKFLVSSGNKSVVVSGGGALVKELKSHNAIHYTFPVYKKNPLTIFYCYKKILPILIKENIDIIHVRSRVPGIIGYFLSQKTQIPLISTCHGYYSVNIFSRFMAWTKFVICPSQIIASHMIEDFSVPPFKIRVIERSVDLERFKFYPFKEKRKDKFIISVIGRLTSLKGHKYFLKSLTKVVRAFPFIQAQIIGTGKKNYEEELKMLARRLSLSNYVKFLGKRDDIPQILKETHLIVVPSICEEAFGRVVIEAQSVGTPVIAFSVGGIKDLIEDEITGLLVSPKDTDVLAQKIIYLIRNPQKCQKISLNARKFVENKFTVESMAKRTLKVYREAKTTQRILIIKISALGDVILSTPSLRAIRRKFKSAQIFLLTGKRGFSVLKNSPYIDEFLVIDEEKMNSFKYIWNFCEKLRLMSFDVSIDLQNSKKTHILAFLGGVKKRYGYNRKMGFLLNYKIKPPLKVISPIEHQKYLLDKIGAGLEDLSLELWLSDEDLKKAKEILKTHTHLSIKKLIGINLGGSKKWETKRWNKKTLLEFINLLSKEGFLSVLTGTKEHLELAEFLESSLGKKIINLCAKTNLRELMGIIKLLPLYVSLDSAPLHIALSLGKKVIAIFGPTLPEKHLPPLKNCYVIRKNLKCLGCYKKKCKTLKCMEIDPKRLLKVALETLKDENTSVNESS